MIGAVYTVIRQKTLDIYGQSCITTRELDLLVCSCGFLSLHLVFIWNMLVSMCLVFVASTLSCFFFLKSIPEHEDNVTSWSTISSLRALRSAILGFSAKAFLQMFVYGQHFSLSKRRCHYYVIFHHHDLSEFRVSFTVLLCHGFLQELKQFYLLFLSGFLFVDLLVLKHLFKLN